jgi:hypothetical protein
VRGQKFRSRPPLATSRQARGDGNHGSSARGLLRPCCVAMTMLVLPPDLRLQIAQVPSGVERRSAAPRRLGRRSHSQAGEGVRSIRSERPDEQRVVHSSEGGRGGGCRGDAGGVEPHSPGVPRSKAAAQGPPTLRTSGPAGPTDVPVRSWSAFAPARASGTSRPCKRHGRRRGSATPKRGSNSECRYANGTRRTLFATADTTPGARRRARAAL